MLWTGMYALKKCKEGHAKQYFSIQVKHIKLEKSAVSKLENGMWTGIVVSAY